MTIFEMRSMVLDDGALGAPVSQAGLHGLEDAGRHPVFIAPRRNDQDAIRLPPSQLEVSTANRVVKLHGLTIEAIGLASLALPDPDTCQRLLDREVAKKGEIGDETPRGQAIGCPHRLEPQPSPSSLVGQTRPR